MMVEQTEHCTHGLGLTTDNMSELVNEGRSKGGRERTREGGVEGKREGQICRCCMDERMDGWFMDE